MCTLQHWSLLRERWCLLLALALALGQQRIEAQNAPIAPNWAQPQWYDTRQSPYQRGHFSPQPSKGQIAFTFSFDADQRATSAAVLNASGIMVRTLWMNRAYHAGTWGEIWDGKDDVGAQTPDGTYEVEVVSNNVRYEWDGVIGTTEADWGGPANWDNTASFPRAIAFAGGRGCFASGYNEGAFATYCFPEDAPNHHVEPLTRVYQSNMPGFDIVTDGSRYYELYQGYKDASVNKAASTSAIIVFDLQGTILNFPLGSPASEFANNYVYPPTTSRTVQVLDRSILMKSAVTGVAVQSSGNVLATAHGEYRPISTGPEVVSADRINLWDKRTGTSLGSVMVPNPQKMTFDNKGNLWVISGFGTHDLLYQVIDVGRSSKVSQPIAGLANPVSLAVSPVTGNLFVADGGTSQQVLEFNPTDYHLVSTLGEPGGYGTGPSCNPKVSNTKFWFDPGPNIASAHLVGQNGPFLTGISVDEHGGLWIMDQTTQRILHFRRVAKDWQYVDRVMSLYWGYQAAVSDGDPSRIFGGFLGFNEFHRNLATPLQPGDPEAQNGNHSWSLVRNWLPCVVTNNTAWDAAQLLSDAFTLPNGTVIYRAYNTKTFNSVLYRFNVDGTLQFRLGTPFGAGIMLEPGTGNYYSASIRGPSLEPALTVYKSSLSGYDEAGFPLWAPATVVASYLAHPNLGEPFNSPTPVALWPTASGIIPVYDTHVAASPGTPSFHLGGLPLGADALRWKSMPQKTLTYPDGNGSYPSILSDQSGRGAFQGGTTAQAHEDNIFAFFNGNWNSLACQVYHFTDDGMFLGQFGFMPNADTAKTGVHAIDKGYPSKQTFATLAPGFCGDVNRPIFVRDRGIYYMFIGDEGYHHGIHEWKISNLGSIHKQVQIVHTVR